MKFTDDAQRTLDRFTSIAGLLDTEVGGYLYGKDGVVTSITTPHATDTRTADTFTPGDPRHIRDLYDHLERGLNLMGTWHTHPSGVTEPSAADLAAWDTLREAALAEGQPDPVHLIVTARTVTAYAGLPATRIPLEERA